MDIFAQIPLPLWYCPVWFCVSIFILWIYPKKSKDEDYFLCSITSLLLAFFWPLYLLTIVGGGSVALACYAVLYPTHIVMKKIVEVIDRKIGVPFWDRIKEK